MDAMHAWGEVTTTVANAHHLDPYLVQAVVWVESRGRADSFRHDPQYWVRHLSRISQWSHGNPRRICSYYGLMQVSYPKAVDLGYDGEPEGLFLPRTNLHWGCRYLKTQVDWAATFPTATAADRVIASLAAYNGGRGGNVPGTGLRPTSAAYASRVLATVNVLRERVTV